MSEIIALPILVGFEKIFTPVLLEHVKRSNLPGIISYRVINILNIFLVFDIWRDILSHNVNGCHSFADRLGGLYATASRGVTVPGVW